MTHPLPRVQKLMTHPLYAPAHPPPPILFDQSLSNLRGIYDNYYTTTEIVTHSWA